MRRGTFAGILSGCKFRWIWTISGGVAALNHRLVAEVPHKFAGTVLQSASAFPFVPFCSNLYSFERYEKRLNRRKHREQRNTRSFEFQLSHSRHVRARLLERQAPSAEKLSRDFSPHEVNRRNWATCAGAVLHLSTSFDDFHQAGGLIVPKGSDSDTRLRRSPFAEIL